MIQAVKYLESDLEGLLGGRHTRRLSSRDRRVGRIGSEKESRSGGDGSSADTAAVNARK